MLDQPEITQPEAVEPDTLLGTVFKKTLAHYRVDVDGQPIDCDLSNRLRKILIYPIADASSLRPRVVRVAHIRAVEPVAIGDVVELIAAGNATGLIVGVKERENALTRLAVGTKPLEQVIAANVDQIVAILAAAQPVPKWDFPEFCQFAGRCRFGASCSHNHEPDCAIKAAVEDGQISVRRHQSYLRLKGYPCVFHL